MFRGGRRGEAAGVKVREFKLYKSNGKFLKGFSQRNNSISFDLKKKILLVQCGKWIRG